MQRIFPPADYNGVEFKFCGVLGDPIVNPDCLAMTEYLLSQGAYCEYSTNGGYNTAAWWKQLGESLFFSKSLRDGSGITFGGKALSLLLKLFGTNSTERQLAKSCSFDIRIIFCQK